MSDRLAPKELLRLLYKIQHHPGVQQQPVTSIALDPQLALLRLWQSDRLAHTYADLLADDHFRPAGQFFLSDIYAPRDFSQRDHDAQHLYTGLKRYLPDLMLQPLADAVHLNQLTDQLDRFLLSVLVEKLGVRDVITPQLYAEGYRLCGNYDERKRQIELMIKILHEVGKGARNRLVEGSLRLAKTPAQKAGWSELYDFLRRGYDACKPIRDFDFFVNTIQKRELTILEKIYSGDANPFDLEKIE